MKIKDLRITCEMCPAQLEGETDDGYFIYARIRFSRFSVALSRDSPPYLGDAPEFFLSGSLPGRYATGNVELLERLTRLYVEMIDNDV